MALINNRIRNGAAGLCDGHFLPEDGANGDEARHAGDGRSERNDQRDREWNRRGEELSPGSQHLPIV